jgi:hypothetical protein
MPDPLGTLKVNTDSPTESGGTAPTEVPVYELNDVRNDYFRVQTPQGPGAISLADVDEAAIPELRMQTGDGLKAVNYSTEQFPRPYEDFSYGSDHFYVPVSEYDISGDGVLSNSSSTTPITTVAGAIGYPQPGDTFIVEFRIGSQGQFEADELEFFFAGNSASQRRTLQIFAQTGINEVRLNVAIPDESINVGYRTEQLAILPVTLNEQTEYGVLVKWFYDYTFSVEVYQGWGDDTFAGGTLLNSEYNIQYWPDTKYDGRGFGIDASAETRINRIRLWDQILP